MIQNIQINPDWFYHKIDDSVVLKNILDDGAILSMRRRGYRKNDSFCWNGLDYISVAKRSTDFNISCYYSSYKSIISGQYAFVLENIDVSSTHFKKGNYDFWRTISRCFPSRRYSCYKDEYQVKDSIPIDKVVGIKIPTKCELRYNSYFPIYTSKDCFVDSFLQVLVDEESNLPFIDVDEGLQMDKSDIKKYMLER